MKTTSKTKRKLYLLSMIWGIIFTSFMLLAVGSKLIMTIIEDGSEFWAETQDSFSTWYDPTAYFITYLIGYIIIWWKPLWGSIIIIIVSIFYMMMGGLDGPPIFAVPGFLVGTFYLTYWFAKRRNELNIN
jgi:hypothetical protein